MGFRLQYFYLLTTSCLLLVVSSCTNSIRQVEPAAQARSAGGGSVHMVRDWPPRLSPSLPIFTTESGKSPEQLGSYGHCQIVDISPGAANPLLLFASQTREVVRPSGKQTDINLTVDDKNISRFVSRQHRFTIAELEPARAHPVRGTVLYLGSIMGIAPAEQKLISKLRLDGWNVIACLPPLNAFADVAELSIQGPDDLPNVAIRFANNIDQYLAERAYVAESVIDYVNKNRPDWLGDQIVVIGSSAGALALPTVVARIGPVDSAVMIGGGANIPEVVLESSLDLSKIVMKVNSVKTRRLTKAESERFKNLALKQMKLDPVNLGSVLHTTPTLLILGTRDTIVPAGNGELLYQQLGKPERWQYPVGHHVLMGALPLHADGIKSWINTQIPAKVTPLPIDFEKRPRFRVRITDNTAEVEDGSRPRIPR